MYGGASDTKSIMYDKEDIDRAWEMPVDALKNETLKIKEALNFGKEIVSSSNQESKFHTPSKRIKEDYVYDYLEVLYEVSEYLLFIKYLETVARDGEEICKQIIMQAEFSDKKHK